MNEQIMHTFLTTLSLSWAFISVSCTGDTSLQGEGSRNYSASGKLYQYMDMICRQLALEVPVEAWYWVETYCGI
jgi:hypothetical protein